MPNRRIPLVTGQIYHVFNRGIDHRPTFMSRREYLRALQTLEYYQYAGTPLKLSEYLTYSPVNQDLLRWQRGQSQKRIELLAYCFMPNHFHFLVRQILDNGISSFMSQFQNSYVRFSNIKHNRTGQLFMDTFKYTHIETVEQLLHVSRYIHLNPFTGHIVDSLEDLTHYPYSSLPSYLQQSASPICNPLPVLQELNGAARYKSFVADQADYQKKLGRIKHLILANEEVAL